MTLRNGWWQIGSLQFLRLQPSTHCVRWVWPAFWWVSKKFWSSLPWAGSRCYVCRVHCSQAKSPPVLVCQLAYLIDSMLDILSPWSNTIQYRNHSNNISLGLILHDEHADLHCHTLTSDIQQQHMPSPRHHKTRYVPAVPLARWWLRVLSFLSKLAPPFCQIVL